MADKVPLTAAVLLVMVKSAFWSKTILVAAR